MVLGLKKKIFLVIGIFSVLACEKQEFQLENKLWIEFVSNKSRFDQINRLENTIQFNGKDVIYDGSIMGQYEILDDTIVVTSTYYLVHGFRKETKHTKIIFKGQFSLTKNKLDIKRISGYLNYANERNGHYYFVLNENIDNGLTFQSAEFLIPSLNNDSVWKATITNSNSLTIQSIKTKEIVYSGNLNGEDKISNQFNKIQFYKDSIYQLSRFDSETTVKVDLFYKERDYHIIGDPRELPNSLQPLIEIIIKKSGRPRKKSR